MAFPSPSLVFYLPSPVGTVCPIASVLYMLMCNIFLQMRSLSSHPVEVAAVQHFRGSSCYVLQGFGDLHVLFVARTWQTIHRQSVPFFSHACAMVHIRKFPVRDLNRPSMLFVSFLTNVSGTPSGCPSFLSLLPIVTFSNAA